MPKSFPKMYVQKFSDKFFKIFPKMYAQKFSDKFFKIFPKCKNFEKFNIFPKVKIQYLNNVGVKSTHPNVHTLCRGCHICLDFKPEQGQLQFCSESSKI